MPGSNLFVSKQKQLLMSFHYKVFLVIAIAAAVLGSCSKNYTSPSSVPDDVALTDARTLTGVVIGMQRRYATSRAGTLYNAVAANGFVTRELILLNAGNVPELQLSTGGTSVDGTNTILENIWINSNKLIFDANGVIEGAKKLGDKNYASGLIAYADIFKALSLGNLAEFWEKTPAGIGQNVLFVDRTDGLKMAIAACDEALTAIAANPISASFTTNIPTGIDVANTLNALKARYALFSGQYTMALAAANAVNLTVKSVFNFDNANLNPIFETATSTNNVFQPTDSTLGLPAGLQPDTADRRVSFYTVINATIAPRFRIAGFGAAATTQWPLYLPGEITLIKAEALARQATPDLTTSLVELNKIITKTAGADPFGVGAALPALTGTYTQAQLLDQIYKNRCIELFMSGLKLEDMRRFSRPVAERKRNFFPYPFRERDNNPNTPADPPF